jgi:hypothetical protein
MHGSHWGMRRHAGKVFFPCCLIVLRAKIYKEVSQGCQGKPLINVRMGQAGRSSSSKDKGKLLGESWPFTGKNKSVLKMGR